MTDPQRLRTPQRRTRRTRTRRASPRSGPRRTQHTIARPPMPGSDQASTTRTRQPQTTKPAQTRPGACRRHTPHKTTRSQRPGIDQRHSQHTRGSTIDSAQPSGNDPQRTSARRDTHGPPCGSAQHTCTAPRGTPPSESSSRGPTTPREPWTPTRPSDTPSRSRTRAHRPRQTRCRARRAGRDPQPPPHMRRTHGPPSCRHQTPGPRQQDTCASPCTTAGPTRPGTCPRPSRRTSCTPLLRHTKERCRCDTGPRRTTRTTPAPPAPGTCPAHTPRTPTPRPPMQPRQRRGTCLPRT